MLKAFGLFGAAVLLAATAGGVAAAEAVVDLYTGQATVTGTVEANRPGGFASSLEDVLVKVSGDARLIGDPRVAALEGEAATMVASFSYHDRMEGIPHHDEQGSRDRPYDLIVSFDPAKVDAALAALGRKPWADPRPRVAVFLSVRTAAAAWLLAADGSSGLGQRQALAAASKRRGVPVAVPDEAALAAAGLTVDAVPEAEPARLAPAVERLGGDVALQGRMVWDEAAIAWTSDWRLDALGRPWRWQTRTASFDDAFRSALARAAQILSGQGQ
jgi:hypothetical protein